LHNQKSYRFCFYLISSDSLSNTLDTLAKYSLCPAVFLGKSINVTYLPQSDATFIFLEKISEVNNSIRTLREFPFWNSRGENHFILYTAVNTTEFLSKLLKLFWKNNILNFVFVFVYKNLEIFTYNPFKTNGIINITR